MIDAKLAERDQLRQLAYSVSSGEMDGMPHGKGAVSDPVGNLVVKLVTLSEEANVLIDRYIDCKNQIIKSLEQLPAKQYGVLHRYYIRNMTWEEVAEDMGCSTRNVIRLKKKALKKLENVIVCHYEV